MRDRSFRVMPDKPKPISPLRQRMIVTTWTARRFSEATRKDYVRHVSDLRGLSRPVAGYSHERGSSRRFQLHPAQQQVSPWSINAAIAALRFFFTVTLRTARPRSSAFREARETSHAKAPVVLSREEAARLPRSRAGPRAQGRAQRRLRRGPQCVRGREPESVRHRQRAHDAQGLRRARGSGIAT